MQSSVAYRARAHLTLWITHAPRHQASALVLWPVSISMNRARRKQLTQGICGVDLENQPAVDILLVGAKNSEDGALLARLREEPIHKHGLCAEGECFPGLPFIGAVSARM